MKGILLNAHYAPLIRPLRNEQGQITQGLRIGNSLYQSQALILQLHKGELKENPAVGCGIEDMLLDNDPIYWRTLIREQLEMDNQQVNSIKITTQGIAIDAHY